MRKSIIEKLTFCTLLLVFVWGVGFLFFLEDMKHAPKEATFQTDAIIVLTGDDGRIAKGFEFLENRISTELFISGVYNGLPIERLMPKNQKNICCVSLGYEATNTEENAVEILEWMAGRGFKSATLITSDYHMKRTLLIFDQHDLNNLTLYPVNVPSKNPWVMAREYTKYLIARALYLF